MAILSMLLFVFLLYIGACWEHGKKARAEWEADVARRVRDQNTK